MEFLIVLIAILLATVILVGVGDRFRLPWPVLLTIAAGGVVFIPGIPEIELDPELILPIFLPPLLWALGARASWQMFRTNWRAIVVYSVFLVVLTILAVTWTALVFIPGIGVAVAIAIGAAVAPPAPVAVEAVAEPVGIPRRLVATLQTEGLFNDAVSLVAFQAALAAITTHADLSAGMLVLQFLYTAAAAVLVGLAAGWLSSAMMRRLTQSVSRSALTLVIPFAVYLIAEELHASGVIAVVVAAVQLSSSKGDLEAADRLNTHAFWEVIELLLTGVAFGLIGLQLRQVLDEAGDRIGTMILHGAVISVVVILLRLLWMMAIAWGAQRKDWAAGLSPRTYGEALVMTWAGMRGLVTLALALSLPTEDFPFRSEALVIAVVVLLFTMIFPGLTLPWLVKKMCFGQEHELDRQERRLLERAAEASQREVMSFAQRNAPPELIARVSENFRRMVPQAPSEEEIETHQKLMEERKKRSRMFREVQRAALAAAQAEVLKARGEPGVDPEAVDRVLFHLDQKAAVSQPEMTAMMPMIRPPGPERRSVEIEEGLRER